MALVGPVGCGKTAILSNWLSTTFRRVLQKETLVLQHHVGATEDAALPITINRRLASLLASLPEAPLDSPRFAHESDCGSPNADVPVDEVVFFRDLLISASKIYNNVVIVLDGVENIASQRGKEPGKEAEKANTDSITAGDLSEYAGSCERSAATSRFEGSWPRELLTLCRQSNSEFQKDARIRLICSAAAHRG